MKYRIGAFFLLCWSFTIGQINQIDANGLKQGQWQKAYEGTRVLKYKGQFKDDKPIGKFTYFYKSSKVKAVIKHDANSTRSVAYLYHENGALMSHGIYRNQKKDSVWINFGPSQRLSNTESYVNGMLNGIKRIYYVPEDINDKSQIPSIVYNYVNDTLDGEFVEYFQSLVVMGRGQYKKNKKHGVWLRYHPNGNKMTLTRYKNGIRHGWCKAYDVNGKEVNSQYYHFGKHIEGKRLKELMQQMKELGINPNE